MSISTDLVSIETLKAAEVFAPGGVEKIIAKVESDVRAIACDASTDEGRAAIKSLAYRVARSKTAIDDMGKEFVSELKRAAATVDADRRTARDRFDALRDEVRKPVDEWEEAEKTRVDAHVANLETLKTLTQFDTHEPTVDEIDARLLTVDGMRGLDWQEFAERAGDLLEKVWPGLTELRATVVRREEERAELERLRKAEALRAATELAEREARAKREREERIAVEAAAKATQEAEERAKAEAFKAEAGRVAAMLRVERAEAEAKAAVKAAEASVENERLRVAEAAALEAANQALRENDKKHRSAINNAALADLMTAAGLTEDQGKAVVKAIAGLKISHVTIKY